MPEVSASYYLSDADFILTSGGTMTDQAGTALCDTSGGKKSSTCNDWSFDTGTYYVEGPVKITGSSGTAGQSAKGGTPVQLTVIAEGSIDVSGSPSITADTSDLIFVTDGDLEISGNMDTSSGGGQMLVHEQVKITRNLTHDGQVIVQNTTSVDDLVTANVLQGNGTITYSGRYGKRHLHREGMARRSGWRLTHRPGFDPRGMTLPVRGLPVDAWLAHRFWRTVYERASPPPKPGSTDSMRRLKHRQRP